MKQIKLMKLITTTMILCMFMGNASAGITYDVPTNMITVTGYTQATPCTFTDLYNADVAGAWGVITIQATSQFYITSRLLIGDGITASWFADTNKQVVFDCPSYPYYWGYKIRILDNAHFRLGALITDKAQKTSGKGCCLRFVQGGGAIVGDINYNTVPTGKLELYSTQIYADTYSYIYALVDAVVYDCSYHNEIAINRFRNASVHRTTISNTRFGPIMVEGNISEIYCTNLRDYGTHFNAEGVHDVIIKDAVFLNCSKLCEAQNPGWYNFYLIDVISDNWIIDYHRFWHGKIYRQNTFNLETTPEAEITIMDYANVVYQDYAYDNGTIDEQVLNVGYYIEPTGSTLHSQNPYSIEIKKVGYHTYAQNFTLNEPIKWRILLLPEGVQVGSSIIRPARRS